MRLHEYERRMLADLFDGRRETVILIPKKNGKSTLLGALALFHLCTMPDAECVIAAASRDQAQIMLRQAQGFIRRSEGLQKRLRVNQREISHKTLGGRIRVLASDVDTADGVIPTLALVDELHRHKSADLYGVFRDGLGPRDGKMVTISTAGDDHTSPLGVLRSTAYAQPGMVREGAYRYVATPSFVMHEWALEPEDDRSNLELVKQANPAPWMTLDALRERRESPSMTDWQWARFACGVWIAGEDAAISDRDWRACADFTKAKIPAGAMGVHVGIDLAWRWDTAAFVPEYQNEDGQYVVGKPVVIYPPRDGTAIQEEELWAPIADFAKRWPQATFVLDPNAGGEAFAQRIANELQTCRVATHPQQPSTMALASQRLAEAIGDKKLVHPDDSELNAHVLASAPRAVGEGWRFVKQKQKAMPIDACIALAMAHSTLVSSGGGNNTGYFL